MDPNSDKNKKSNFNPGAPAFQPGIPSNQQHYYAPLEYQQRQPQTEQHQWEANPNTYQQHYRHGAAQHEAFQQGRYQQGAHQQEWHQQGAYQQEDWRQPGPNHNQYAEERQCYNQYNTNPQQQQQQPPYQQQQPMDFASLNYGRQQPTSQRREFQEHPALQRQKQPAAPASTAAQRNCTNTNEDNNSMTELYPTLKDENLSNQRDQQPVSTNHNKQTKPTVASKSEASTNSLLPASDISACCSSSAEEGSGSSSSIKPKPKFSGIDVSKATDQGTEDEDWDATDLTAPAVPAAHAAPTAPSAAPAEGVDELDETENSERGGKNKSGSRTGSLVVEGKLDMNEGTVKCTAVSGSAVGVSSPSVSAGAAGVEVLEDDSTVVVDVAGEDTSVIEELKGKYAKLKEPDARPHLNVVFIGHVDAGKSTTCGNILFLTGQVDQRAIEKYEKEAKEKNRETWFFAFITDINEEERQKGKTVEVGRATFSLEHTRFTILDAPGHKNFVPNMIGGAAQADVAVLIISARKGEFETGFERGGQTREHAMLAKTLGVSQLIVAVNKMDDPTCNWNEERYREIERKVTPFLKGCGYNPAKDIFFVPISGLGGENLKLHVTDPSFKHAKEAEWYKRPLPTLFEILDSLKPPERNEKDPIRIPLLEGFRDQGVMAIGKVEAGTVIAGQSAVLMPKRIKIQITGVQINDEDVARAKPGENVTLRVVGVEEDQITKGMVLCSLNNPCPIVSKFKAQVMVVELLDHRPLLTAGYSCVIHAHTACEEVQLMKLLEVVDKQTKKKKLNPQFVKGNSLVVCLMQTNLPMCLETFEDRQQLGRFTLRDEGKTIAIGKVLEVFS